MMAAYHKVIIREGYTGHFIAGAGGMDNGDGEMDGEAEGIPLHINARPRLVGRRPLNMADIETDVFHEKAYKQYSSQHLRDALIAVKKGFSVYAASNKYGVPRKTLRNWMEKYDIKSQFSKGKRGVKNNPIIERHLLESQVLDPLSLMVERRSRREGDRGERTDRAERAVKTE